MIIFKKAHPFNIYIGQQKREGKRIGFVPTMGALHAGHLSLISKATKENDITVCSIFINPTQFNDKTDYEKYPTTIEEDIHKIEAVGTDILFLPDADELYPEGTAHLEQYELSYLETVLEGKFRPGHFQGVCQVMNRLLKIVKPDKLFMGQKDYQQSLVVQQLIHANGARTELVVCTTKREPGGLAMSSRNMRLKEHERKKASVIFQALVYIKQNLQRGDLTDLKHKACLMLIQEGLKIDYVEIADAHTLHLADKWDGKQELVALAAAYLNDVRLIDNMLLNS
jgi:pantoate--beta-alanine ligase